MGAHLVILPVLLPFVAGLLQLTLRHRGPRLRRGVGVAALGLQVAAALALVGAVAGGEVLVYRLGDWAAPWGIVLVADRLSAWMVVITALLALFALVHATLGVDEEGPHFHPLFQMQLFGIAGAFLTGDLFNLFVFFEVLLIASYGLLLHGGGAGRVRAGLHYVVLNLLGSTVFLFAAGVLYGTLGTLNMADLAVRAAAVAPEDLGLVRAGGLLLLGVFALKAALVPVYLWLPAAYANAAPAVAALFAIMTKVGAYAILRSHTLLFGDGAVAGLYDPWLLPLGLVTVVVGALGALAAPRLGLLAAYLVVVSVGTLLAAFALGGEGVAAGLYYLPHSTFAAGALFLLVDALARRRPRQGDRLLGDVDLPRAGLWGGVFVLGAILVAGLPPSSGFIGKLLVLQAAAGHEALAWVWAVVLGSALLGLVAFVRAGSRVFFKTEPGAPAPAPGGGLAAELTAIGGLVALTLVLTLAAGPAVEFSRAMAAQLAEPALYIQAVLPPAEVTP